MAKRSPSTMTPAGERVVADLARRVRRARLARNMTQAELALRARVSEGTVKRIERGEPGVALWAWLGVLEILGLLGQLALRSDPVTAALLEADMRREARRGRPPTDLDF